MRYVTNFIIFSNENVFSNGIFYYGGTIGLGVMALGREY